MKISLATILQPARLKQLPYQFAEHAFLFFLGLLCVAIVFSLILFYFFVWAPQQSSVPPPANIIRFQSAAFDRVMEIQQERAERFEAADNTAIQSIFQHNPSQESAQDQLPNE